MANFEYKATDDDGNVVKGVLEADDEDDLLDKLENRHLYLISSKHSRKRNGGGGSSGGGRRIVRAKVKRADLISFTVHLATVISAGVPIIQGLDDMIEETDNPSFKNVIQGIKTSIEDGNSISDSFAQYPSVFSELYIAILQSGETTGRLDNVLKEIVSFLEWQDALVGQIKQATTYPTMVLFGVIGFIGLVFTFVLPRFLGVFDNFDIELPLPTRIVIGISEFFQGFWWLMLAAIIASVIGYRAANKTAPEGWRLTG